MAPTPTAAVTAQGIRDGDRAALGALVARRGTAVLAYCDRVAAPGRALEAAGEAFARFRREVVAAAEPRALDPEALLLGGTRRAAAACAPRPTAPRGALARRRGTTCVLVPELLAARAAGDLTAADRMRLARHLERCEDCRAAETRFAEGERAYHDAPDVPPPDPAAGGLLAALRAAAPNADERRPAPRPEPVGAVTNGNGPAAGAPQPGADQPGAPWTAAAGAPPTTADQPGAGRTAQPPTTGAGSPATGPAMAADQPAAQPPTAADQRGDRPPTAAGSLAAAPSTPADQPGAPTTAAGDAARRAGAGASAPAAGTPG
ncbi:MAG TPA: zf-HC2 domain-containing protein, partial [Solirubrobacteraceae bacterium]